jgi:rod shape-determining protein MreD
LAVNPYIAGLLLLITALLQDHFLPGFLPGVSQYVPDLMLLVVVSWSLLLDVRIAMVAAFAAGIILDFVAAPQIYPVGLNAFLFCLIALLVGYLGNNPFISGNLRSVPVALVSALVYRVALLLAERVLGYNNFQPAIIVQVILPVVVIDAALMILIFGLVRVLSRIKAPRE